MFLNELTRFYKFENPDVLSKITSFYNKDADDILEKMDFIKQLDKLGWRKIGAGYFSYVFENPNYNFILKVN